MYQGGTRNYIEIMYLWFSKLEFVMCEELDPKQFEWNLNTTSCVKNWTQNGYNGT
jgi:hypothetical protein